MTLSLTRKHVLSAEERALLAKADAIKARQRKAAKKDRPKQVRPEAKGQREPRIRNNGFLAYLRRQPCLRCGKTPSDAAHVRFVPAGSGWRSVGKGEKPNDLGRCVSLCRECHSLQHSMSEARFWSDVLRLDPVEVCTELARRYEAGE